MLFSSIIVCIYAYICLYAYYVFIAAESKAAVEKEQRLRSETGLEKEHFRAQMHRLALALKREREKSSGIARQELEQLRLEFLAREERYVLDGDREELRNIRHELAVLRAGAGVAMGGAQPLRPPVRNMTNNNDNYSAAAGPVGMGVSGAYHQTPIPIINPYAPHVPLSQRPSTPPSSSHNSSGSGSNGGDSSEEGKTSSPLHRRHTQDTDTADTAADTADTAAAAPYNESAAAAAHRLRSELAALKATGLYDDPQDPLVQELTAALGVAAQQL